MAYLLLTRNEEDDRTKAIENLKNHCQDDIENAISIAHQFDVFNDKGQYESLWNRFINKANAKGKPDILLKFSDAYEQPQKFVAELSKDTKLDDIYDNLIYGLEKVDQRTRVMNSAKIALKAANEEAYTNLLNALTEPEIH